MYNIEKGDILVFMGNGWWSYLVKLFTFDSITHIAIATDKDIILESEKNKNTRLISVEEKFKNYDGYVLLYKLNTKSRNTLIKNEKQFDRIVMEVQCRKYDLELIFTLAAYKIFPFFKWKEDTRRLICIETVGTVLEKTGIIPDINVSELSFRDILEFNIYEKNTGNRIYP